MLKRSNFIKGLVIAVIFCGTLLPSALLAQYNPGTYVPGRDSEFQQTLEHLGGNPFASLDEDEEGVQRDSTERKVRKPLESYFFDDSVRTRNIFIWNIDPYFNKVHLIEVDTTMNEFEIMYPFLKKGVGDNYQGPLGGASIPINYADRPAYQDFSWAQAYNTYYFFPGNTRFFNVKTPYSLFTYMTAGQKRKAEENFGITHAQNISPSSGFNLDYKSRGTRGIYSNQKTRAKNLSMAFSHTGKRYSVHAGYIYNTIQNRENGGLVLDSYLTDTLSIDLPENYPMKLQDAYNEIKNNTFYAVQSYGIPFGRSDEFDFTIADQTSLFFGHYFEYSRWTKMYTDTRAQSSDYYMNWFIHPTITRDSIAESRITNRLFVQLQPFDRDGIVGLIDGGVGVDNHKFHMFIPSMYLSGLGDGVRKTSYYVYGSVSGKFRQYLGWGGDIRFHPAGYRSGDINIGAEISLSAFIKGEPVTLSGKFSHDRRSPDYWSTQFFSNHYVWSNSFDKENETRIEASLRIPTWNIELGATQSVVNNKIYYDATGHPVQSSESVSVSGLYARKDFRAGGFHFNHRVLLQWSTSQEVVPVPLAGAFASYFFEFPVVRLDGQDVLRVQFGLDGRYNTKYYAPGWNPATTTFYNQREKQVGDYPMVDVFVNAKWKRMRILLKMEHLNEDMFGTRNFFSIPHYPLNKRIFKLGFSWGFYN